MADKIRVRLRRQSPPPMVQDYRRMYAGTRAYLGLKHDPEAGHEYLDTQTGLVQRTGGFRVTDQVIELPRDEHFHDYLQHVRQGDLVPVDAATAAACGVPWAGHAEDDDGPDSTGGDR